MILYRKWLAVLVAFSLWTGDLPAVGTPVGHASQTSVFTTEALPSTPPRAFSRLIHDLRQWGHHIRPGFWRFISDRRGSFGPDSRTPIYHDTADSRLVGQGYFELITGEDPIKVAKTLGLAHCIGLVIHHPQKKGGILAHVDAGNIYNLESVENLRNALAGAGLLDKTLQFHISRSLNDRQSQEELRLLQTNLEKAFGFKVKFTISPYDSDIRHIAFDFGDPNAQIAKLVEPLPATTARHAALFKDYLFKRSSAEPLKKSVLGSVRAAPALLMAAGTLTGSWAVWLFHGSNLFGVVILWVVLTLVAYFTQLLVEQAALRYPVTHPWVELGSRIPFIGPRALRAASRIQRTRDEQNGTPLAHANWIHSFTERAQALDQTIRNMSKVPGPDQFAKVHNALSKEIENDLPQIEARLTEGHTSLGYLLEKAVDFILQRTPSKTPRIHMGLIDLPLTHLNQLSKRYHEDGLADHLKANLIMAINQKSRLHPDPEAPLQAAMNAGQIVLLHFNPENLAHQQVIHESWAQVLDLYTSKPNVKESLSPLKLDVVHWVIDLSPIPAHSPDSILLPSVYEDIDAAQMEKSMATLTRLEAQEYEAFSAEEKINLALNRWTNAQSQALQSYRLLAADDKTRNKRSLLAEHLFAQTLKLLNLRMHAAKKTSNAIPSEGRITFHKDSVLEDYLQSFQSDAQGLKALNDALADLENRRRNSLPLFNFHTKHLPRPLHNLPDPTRVKEALELWKNAPQNNEAKEKFIVAYRDYAVSRWKGFILAFRDPRLPELHKLSYTDEDYGNIMERRDAFPIAANSIRELTKDQVNHPPYQSARMAADLVQPGFLIFKRAVGDELGIVFFDPQQPDHYVIGFVELNGGKAYFEKYPPNETDATLHRIFLNLHERGMQILKDPAKQTPQDRLDTLMEEVNEIIDRNAPGEFQKTVKIDVNGTTHRVPVFKDNTGKEYAVIQNEEDPKFYEKDETDESAGWKLLSDATHLHPQDLTPSNTKLSATRVVTNKAISWSLINLRRAFEALDRAGTAIKNSKTKDSVDSVVGMFFDPTANTLVLRQSA